MNRMNRYQGAAIAALLVVACSLQAKKTEAPAAYEIREADGVPYLWENGMPYFARFQETDHQVLDLAGTWKFKTDPDDRGVDERWFAPAASAADWKDHPVPGSWQAVFPDLLEYIGAGWYRRDFTPPAEMKGRFNRLVFDGAGFHTRVWLNGVEIGHHCGNYSRWSLDAADTLKYGQMNTIVIRVDNVLGWSDVPPRISAGGRLGWWEYAGLQREVRLESSPLTTVCKLHVYATPNYPGGLLGPVGLVYNAGPDPAQVRVALTLTDLAGKVLIPDAGRDVPEQVITVPARDVAGFNFLKAVPEAKLWSPEAPENRYRLTLSLTGAGGERQSLEIGFRKFAARGPALFLNDQPYYIRGINRHEDDLDTGLYQSDRRMEEDVALLKDLGVNHLRLAHYPNDPRWLDRLDERGFTITEEVPLYQAGSGVTNALEVTFLGAKKEALPPGVEKRSASRLLHQQADSELIANGIHQLLETIERDLNHPSIVMWSVGNENMTLSPWPSSRRMHQRMIDAGRRMDSSRLYTFAVITAAGLSPALESVAGIADVISVNEYYGWYYGKMEQVGPYLDRVHKKWPDKPIIVSEFGADAIPGNHAPAGTTPEKFTEEYQAQLLEYTWTEMRRRDFIVGGMPWIFADFRCGWSGSMHPTHHMNEKGIVGPHRDKKLGYDVIKRIYGEVAAEKG